MVILNLRMYLIVVIIIIVIIYILISYRDWIKYYFCYIKSDLKYKKDVRKNLKLDLKTRMLSDKDIELALKFLKESLEKIGYKNKGEFIIPDYLKRKLIYSKFSVRALKELFTFITQHMGIDDQGVELDVKNVSSKEYNRFAGLYFQGNKILNKKITIFINPDYSYETVLSIFIHETTHYFLLTRKIELEDRDANEYLTDLATIYLGFGKYMLEGYKQSKKIVYLDEFNRTVSSYKIGYINYSDVKYAMKQIRNL